MGGGGVKGTRKKEKKIKEESKKKIIPKNLVLFSFSLVLSFFFFFFSFSSGLFLGFMGAQHATARPWLAIGRRSESRTEDSSAARRKTITTALCGPRSK
jgi:hypothetical protein